MVVGLVFTEYRRFHFSLFISIEMSSLCVDVDDDIFSVSVSFVTYAVAIVISFHAFIFGYTSWVCCFVSLYFENYLYSSCILVNL